MRSARTRRAWTAPSTAVTSSGDGRLERFAVTSQAIKGRPGRVVVHVDIARAPDAWVGRGSISALDGRSRGSAKALPLVLSIVTRLDGTVPGRKIVPSTRSSRCGSRR